MADKKKYTKQAPKKIEGLEYSEEEKEYRKYIIKRLTRARNQRYTEYYEFNDMNYPDYYVSNQKAANSYIKPRKNRQDANIVTGTTEEKEISLLAALLNFDFEPIIKAYDRQNMSIKKLGEVLEPLIFKSREMEEIDFQSERVLIYKELLDQGTVFVEDQYYEWEEVVKTLQEDWGNLGEFKKTWTESKTIKSAFRTNLIPGPNVYLGDIRQPSIAMQPFIATRRMAPYDVAEQIYGSWPRWKYVPKDLQAMKFDESAINEPYNNYFFEDISKDHVEIMMYQDRSCNDLMILINGIMMLPCGFPLSALSGKNEYTVSQTNLFPLGKAFAYGKGIPSKTKVDQAVIDEMYKLIVLKTRQSFVPPMANNTGKTVSDETFYPGRITNNINPNQLQPIMDVKGVSGPEFSAFQFVNNMISDKTVSPTFAGQGEIPNVSATATLENKKQSMMKLGVPIIGVMFLEKSMAKARMNNILFHWSKTKEVMNPVTGNLEEKYQTFFVDTIFSDGVNGVRAVEFTDDVPEQPQVDAENMLLTERVGKPVRKAYINPKLIDELGVYLYFEVKPKEKDMDAFRRTEFMQAIGTGLQMFGPDKFNMPWVQREYAHVWDLPYEKAFVQQPPVDMGQQGMPMPMAEGPSQGAAQVAMGNTTPPVTSLQELSPLNANLQG